MVEIVNGADPGGEMTFFEFAGDAFGDFLGGAGLTTVENEDLLSLFSRGVGAHLILIVGCFLWELFFEELCGGTRFCFGRNGSFFMHFRVRRFVFPITKPVV